jgi:hypothetical protein
MFSTVVGILISFVDLLGGDATGGGGGGAYIPGRRRGVWKAMEASPRWWNASGAVGCQGEVMEKVPEPLFD